MHTVLKNLNKLNIKKNILIFVFIFVSFFLQSFETSKTNEKVVIKVFSSLTCPHCANFHQKVVVNLKNDYLNKNLVKFEHHSFPLDMAALNAEKILRCIDNSEKKFEFLSIIYKKQEKWAVGSDINIINDSIKKIGKEVGLKNKYMDKCLSNEKIQDEILNERIDAQKNYKITSTPTVYINEKKYEGKHEYKVFKKELDKLL